MANCERCGASDLNVRLYDSISSERVLKLCNDCQKVLGFPIIKRPTTFQLKAAERKPTVYERLSKSAGIAPKEDYGLRKKQEGILSDIEKQNITLRDLIDKKMKERIDFKSPEEDSNDPLGLVENFNWHIMMARKKRKMTYAQVAKEIGEAEYTVKMIEQGKLPSNEYKLISKLETYFGIKLRNNKNPSREQILNKPSPARFSLDPVTLKNITISDLQKMKAEKNEKLSEKLKEDFDEEEIDENIEEIVPDVDPETGINWTELKKKVGGK